MSIIRPPPSPPPPSLSTPSYRYVEECQLATSASRGIHGLSFGTLLDSGTGVHSLRWISSLEKASALDSFVAVTADEAMRKSVQEESDKLGTKTGRVVIGNWASTSTEEEENLKQLQLASPLIISDKGRLLPDEKFDTVLADYLIGAIDGFSPYFQERVFSRLVEHLKPGGFLYVVGLNPIPDEVDGPADVFCRVTKARDACILLAGHRCYREFPVDWVRDKLGEAGLEIRNTRCFPILYTHAAIVRQINVGRSKLGFFRNKALADGMRNHLDALEAESEKACSEVKGGRLQLGFDYVVCAELPAK